MQLRYPCLFCLASDSTRLRLDKKGRPYSVCQTCGTRSFMHSRIALRGFRLLGARIAAIWQSAAQATQVLATADREIDAELANGSLAEPRESAVF